MKRERPMLKHLGGVVDDPATEWEFGAMRRRNTIEPDCNVIQLLQAAGGSATV